MGQTFSLATLSAGSAGIDVPELSDLSYEKPLGTARFMKSIRARHQHGLVVVKLVMKPFPQLDLGQYVKAIRCEYVAHQRSRMKRLTDMILQPNVKPSTMYRMPLATSVSSRRVRMGTWFDSTSIARCTTV